MLQLLNYIYSLLFIAMVMRVYLQYILEHKL